MTIRQGNDASKLFLGPGESMDVWLYALNIVFFSRSTNECCSSMIQFNGKRKGSLERYC